MNQFQTAQPDVILLNIEMPNMNGLQFLRNANVQHIGGNAKGDWPGLDLKSLRETLSNNQIHLTAPPLPYDRQRDTLASNVLIHQCA